MNKPVYVIITQNQNHQFIAVLQMSRSQLSSTYSTIYQLIACYIKPKLQQKNNLVFKFEGINKQFTDYNTFSNFITANKKYIDCYTVINDQYLTIALKLQNKLLIDQYLDLIASKRNNKVPDYLYINTITNNHCYIIGDLYYNYSSLMPLIVLDQNTSYFLGTDERLVEERYYLNRQITEDEIGETTNE